jgi:3'(2'), 5'-bisphosphate nucleotidase
VTPAARAALVPAIVALVREAGRAIVARRGAAARLKRDESPVTDADEACERAVVAGLRRLTPGIPIVSEEQIAAGEAPFAAGGAPAEFWLVDPLDGTREFVAGRDEYSVNIALVEAGFPALGVVHGPADDVTWAASGPGTATRADRGGAPRPIRARPAPADGVVVVSSRSHGDAAALAAYLEDHRVAAHRRLGSALKFGLLAEGAADLYPRFGPTMEWDTAAGQAVLEAAGGRVETVAGRRLGCGRPDFRNPDFVARGA